MSFSVVKDLYPYSIRIALSGFADIAMVTSAINQSSIYKFLTMPVGNELLRHTIKEAFVRFESVSGEK